MADATISDHFQWAESSASLPKSPVLRLPVPSLRFVCYYPGTKTPLPEIWLKVHEIIERLERDGWNLVRTRGSHRQFQHSSKPGTVTVSGKPSMDLRPGTLNSILRQAGLK